MRESHNLVLICKVHHKLMDDQPGTYTVARLRQMKEAHERWVRETLGRQPAGGRRPRPELLERLRTGKELADVVGGAYAFVFDHDESDTEADAKLVGGFLRSLREWDDIWSDLDSGQHVEARFALTGSVREVEAARFLVFGARQRRKMRSGDQVFDWPLAVVTVVRPSNPGITELGQFTAVLLN